MRAGAKSYLRRTPVQMGDLVWFVVHHTGRGATRPTVWDTARYQVGPDAHLAFPAMAYTWFVEADGTAYLCHDPEAVTWAQGSGSPYAIDGVGVYNWLGLACCFSGEEPTEAQIEAIARIAGEADRLVGHTLVRCGHRDVSRDEQGQPLTECPGDGWSGWRHRIGA